MEDQAEHKEEAATGALNSGAETRAEQAQNAPAKKETELGQEAGAPKEPDYKAEMERYKKEAEQGRHAMARLRKESAARNAEWERRFSELEGKVSPAKAKTRSDFGSDAEWQEYAMGELENRMVGRVLKELSDKRGASDRGNKALDELRQDVTKFAGPEDGAQIWDDLNDRYSEAYEIIANPRSKAMLDEMASSKARGAMFALLSKRPDIFRTIGTLTPTRQAMEITRLERALLDTFSKKKETDKEAAKRSGSLPAVGSFGTNGRGSTDMTGLSSQQRVDRFREEIRKRRA